MILELSSMGFQVLPWWWDWKPLKVGPFCHFSADVQQGDLYYRRNTL